MKQVTQLVPLSENRPARVPEPVDVLDVSRFQQMTAVAEAMAAASLIPDHLKVYADSKKTELDEARTSANCFLVVNQAVRWGLDPFAVMGGSYVISGKLGWEGKVISAVINSRAGLRDRLSFEYQGQGDGREVTVSGTFRAESKVREISGTVGDWKTNNEMWKKGGVTTDQKLAYTGAVWWARRFTPELVLGVLTEGEELPRGGLAEIEIASGGRPLLEADIAVEPPAEEPVHIKREQLDDLRDAADRCGFTLTAAFGQLKWDLPENWGKILDTEFDAILEGIRLTGIENGGCKTCGVISATDFCSPECESANKKVSQ